MRFSVLVTYVYRRCFGYSIFDRLQTVKYQNIGGGHVFQNLENSAKNNLTEVKDLQEMIINQQKWKFHE
jgi:hypothetical protein